MPTSLTKSQLEKLGNTLVFLSTNVGEFTKTKALKLLFLLEENSIKKFGVPFFGLDFKVWKFGPVIEEVFEDLDQDNIPLLKNYIRRVKENREEFEAAAKFNDDEFSNNDIKLLEEIVNFARHKTAKDLVEITHSKDSLWKAKVTENHLEESFKSKNVKSNRTDILIDFSKLFSEKDEYLRERYEASQDFITFNNHINA